MRASFRPTQRVRPGLATADLVGLFLVAATGLATWAFRALIISPRAYVAICASHVPPLICVPRQAVLWLQFMHLWGFSSLLLGILAFALRSRALAIAAVALGTAATVNYNATEGIIGAAFGLWAWLDRAVPDHATPRGPHAREH